MLILYFIINQIHKIMTYVNGLSETQIEQSIQKIIEANKCSLPVAAEMHRLGPVFCDEHYYKKYRVMSLEQLAVATGYYEFLTKGLKPEDFEDDENELLNEIFAASEDAFTAGGENFEETALIETEFVIKFRNWIEENDLKVTLNPGMLHWLSCAIESYLC